MDLIDDRPSPEHCAYNRSSAASESDQSSLISCGSTTVSLGDSYLSDRESYGPSAERMQPSKATVVVEQSYARALRPPSRTGSLVSAGSGLQETETQRLLDAGPAPPDYAQATAERSSAPLRPADENSLYSDDDHAHAELAAPTSKAKGIRRLFRQSWKRFCLLNLAIYCTLTTTLLIVGLVASRKAPVPQLESKVVLDTFPAEHPLNNPFHQERYHQSTEQCHFQSYPQDFFFFSWLDPDDFHFQESLKVSDYLEHPEFSDISISGQVDVRPAPYGQAEPIEVVVSYAMTPTWEGGIPEWYTDSETLHIHHPTLESILRSQSGSREVTKAGGSPQPDPAGRPCLDIWVGIYVKAQLNNFSLVTENLHIDIGHSYSYNRYGGFSFRIRDDSQVHTRTGNITIADWDARNANITSEAGSIQGTFQLNDNLHLETTGGDVDATIHQEAAHEKQYLDSHPPGKPANLSTITGSGRQRLRIYQQLNAIVWAERLGYGYPFSLQSSHSSDSGSISIMSSIFWGGQIHATSTSGSIDLQGNEVQLLPNPVDEIARGDESNDVWAEKGTYDSLMTIETRDGNISVCVESDWECNDFLPYMSGSIIDDREPTELDWDDEDPCEWKQCQVESVGNPWA